MDSKKNINLEERYLRTALLILGGYTKEEFLQQKISEDFPEWNATEKEIKSYIIEAKKIIKYDIESIGTESDLEDDIALSRLDSLYVMNYKIQDYRECRNIIADRAKLLKQAKENKSKKNKIKNDNFRTLDILEIISEEVILTYEILRLRFPDVNFDERDDTTFFKNARAFNKSSVLNEMLSDKKKFDRDIYDILINDDLIDTDNLIRLEIVKNNHK